MQRRTFVKSALAAASLAAMAKVPEALAQSPERSQFFEFRTYSLKDPRQFDVVNSFWEHAAIPAFNRLGIKPIGVFTELDKPDVSKLFVVIPYDSIDQFASIPDKLAADSEYQQAGSAYLNAPKAEPAYDRFESNILVAFEGMKRLQVPPEVKNAKSWIFELRMYESRSESMAINKQKMFNSGEIPLMEKVDLSPIFFGESLAGAHMPNLIYMVSGEDKEAHKKHWKAFFDAPEWKKLSGDPQYKDNVSKVVSTFLKRTSASQI
jgi:hypothetical protein